MTKEEATTNKTEATSKTTEAKQAKEEGVTLSVKYEDIQQNRRTKILTWSFVAIIFLAIVLIIFLTLMKPPVPRFMLDTIAVEPVSESNVRVNLLSTNPSSTTNIYYSKMSVCVQTGNIFLTESFLFQNTLQKPHEHIPWTAVVAINNRKDWKNDNPSVGDLMQHADVVADVKIHGKYGILKNSLRVTCPIAIPVNDSFRAIVSKPCQVI